MRNNSEEKTEAPEPSDANSIQTLTQEQATESNAIQIPSISLPKGGGALKGIDEKFEVNPANGTAGLSIPLPVSPSRNGFHPSLSLSYNSGSGNSPFGLGWSLTYPAIHRKTDKRLPRYQEGEDVFMFSGAEDLVPFLEEDTTTGALVVKEITTTDGYTATRYRPRVEGGFAKIEKIYHVSHGVYWKVTTRDNIVTIFGRTSAGRISDPGDPERIFQWLPEFSYDNKGNYIQYHYKKDSNITTDGTLQEDPSIPNEVYEKNRKSGVALFTNTYLKRVAYGNRDAYYPDVLRPYDPQNPENNEHFFEIVIDYGEHDQENPSPVDEGIWEYRVDAFSSYRSGFEIRTNRLCKRILMFHHFNDEHQFTGTLEETPFGENYLVRSLDLEYEPSSINDSGQTEVTYLQSVTQTGYIRKPDGTYSKKSLPPTTYTYQELHWNTEIKNISKEDIINAPVGLTNNYEWVDLYGEGISGILTEQGEGWYYKSNLGKTGDNDIVKFTNAQPVFPKPSFTGFGNGVLSLQDLEANGEKQIVVNSPGVQGYFELTNTNDWKNFRPFEQRVNSNLQDPNTRLLDLDGDGQPELVMTEEHVFAWYAADGKRGYQPVEFTAKTFDEEQGPAIVFADAEQTIFLADMSGDGLTDIVRIRNGEICYWANMGYGDFSARITMGNAPVFDHPEAFNPRYLHLADVSGTGATDIIYLGQHTFKAFINLSGNAWSDAHTIEPFFPIDQNSKLSVIDLLGTGTACIVWSSDLPAEANAPMRYIDLMHSKKPHILTNYINNLGKETSFKYKSATHFYLEDKQQGNPWITKLPFPVQVVAKTIVTDTITRVRFTSEYRYHHGYYDHPEREFRGFGMVEQLDTEFYEDWKRNNAGNLLEKSEQLYQAPVLTKTWYHTGAFLNREQILSHFETTYWYEVYNRAFPESSLTIAEPKLPDGKVVAAPNTGFDTDTLSTDEWREALRACKGMVLRQEVFSLDAPAVHATLQERQKQFTPYSVATHNCHIQWLQPRDKNSYAVFMVTQSEALSIQYERNPEDPRIAHTINVKIDELGHVLEAASVVYPRKSIPKQQAFAQLRTEAAGLTYAREEEKNTYIDSFVFAEAEQGKTWISYTQNTFTQDITENHTYRLRLPATIKAFEITGLPSATTLYRPEDFETVLDPSREISYQAVPDLSRVQHRLIEYIQNTYYNENLNGELPLGQMASHGIPYQGYQLAYTPALLAHIFDAGQLPADTTALENLLSDNDNNTNGDQTYSQCRFVHRGDENWWIRSGTVQFLNDGEDLIDVQQRFFSPVAYVDPFGSETRVTYYSDYYLFVASTTDAVGNESHVDTFNFRILTPTQMRDINNNISAVLLDELGLVKAMAAMGKGTEADALTGLTEYTDTSERETIQTYFTISDGNRLHIIARQLLQNATVRFVYDFDRYQNSAALLEAQLDSSSEIQECEKITLLPTVAGNIARERHHQDILSDPEVTESPLQLSFEYSEGMGNVAMTKVQAEPGEALQLAIRPDCSYTVETIDTGAALRWIGNGRTILNNKGNPVKQYEPYFSVNPFYEDHKELVERGVTPVIYYDAVGRTIRTELPDGTHTRVQFDAWQQSSYDQNDTILENDDPLASGNSWYKARISGTLGAAAQKAAEKAAIHHNTPSQLFLDSLGRPVMSVAHNRWEEQRTGQPPMVYQEYYATRIILDIEGNPKAVIDARANTVMSWKYDMLGHRVHQHSMDAGRRWMLNNVAGNPITTWDERGHVFSYTYDILQRPLTTHVSGGDGSTPLDHSITRIVYGEGLSDAQARNLRGQVYQQYDTSGLLQTERLDFKGNLLQVTRQLAAAYDAAAIHWPAIVPAGLLESEIYTKTTVYDALNRMVTMHNWHYNTTDAGRYVPQYNARGLLVSEALTVNGSTAEAVRNIQYNEKGQRMAMHYGNGTMTRYYYDPLTYRLVQLRTTRNPRPGETLPTLPGDMTDANVFQNLFYTYDSVGNITEIYDNAFEPVFFNNQIVLPRNRYTYDSLYRLILATGRENSTFNTAPQQQEHAAATASFPISDPLASRNYTQRYIYDSVGNILLMRHWAGNGEQTERWTRNYIYATDSNRLLRTYTNSNPTGIIYIYDAHGSMLNFNNTPAAYTPLWDYRDMIREVSMGGGGTAFYQYDGTKQRTRKRITRNDGSIEERIYLEGMEFYRKWQGITELEAIETHHLFVDDQRILLVEDVLRSNEAHLPIATLYRYQYSNHLGSVGLELTAEAAIISYEEYHPYGTPAYNANNTAIQAAAKRYRYTGMERDEESGLNYHTARYYLPWLGRWLSSDPIGVKGGINVYEYVKSGLPNLKDTKGKQPEETLESDPAQLMSLWPYGTPVPDRQSVGHNVQRHHVVEASVRAAQRGRTGRQQRAISSAAGQSTVLVETGRGYYHTIAGRYLREIRLRVRSGVITSESDLIDAVRQAHQLAAEDARVSIDQSVIDAAILEDQALLHETLETTRAELESAAAEATTTVTDESIDTAFSEQDSNDSQEEQDDPRPPIPIFFTVDDEDPPTRTTREAERLQIRVQRFAERLDEIEIPEEEEVEVEVEVDDHGNENVVERQGGRLDTGPSTLDWLALLGLGALTVGAALFPFDGPVGEAAAGTGFMAQLVRMGLIAAF